MPRPRRFAPSGSTFHVINRGNDKQRLFFEDSDYQGFVELLSLGKRRHSVKLFGVCVMPNHFHALVRPEEEGALSAYFQSVQCCYACYFRSRTQTVGNGHVFQRRFWSAQIQDDYHFLNVLRYIEANPIAGDLVVRAEEWPWSSATLRPRAAVVLDTLPLRLPLEWSEMVHNDAHELPL